MRNRVSHIAGSRTAQLAGDGPYSVSVFPNTVLSVEGNSWKPIGLVGKAIGWTVVRQCSGGEFGAFLVERGAERAILKAWPDLDSAPEISQSIELARRVHARGQLVPEYLNVGTAAGASYSLQRFVEGELPKPLTLAHARQLVALLEAHRDAAVGAAYDWPRWRRTWNRSILTSAAPRVRAIADELADVPGVDSLDRPHDDVSHGDYHHQNLLVRGDQVVTVFDWEGAHPGDRQADLFKLAWWSAARPDHFSPDATAFLTTTVRSTLTGAELASYAADVATWMIDFFATAHPETLDAWLLNAVEQVLAPMWRTAP